MVHSARMKEDFLLAPGIRRCIPELFPGLIRPDLYARAIRIFDKNSHVRLPYLESRPFERRLQSGRIEVGNADANMIDPFGLTRRSRRNRHIARPEAQVTARRPAIFKHLVAEQAPVEHEGFVDIADGQRDMVHTSGAQQPSIRTSLTHPGEAESKQCVTPA